MAETVPFEYTIAARVYEPTDKDFEDVTKAFGSFLTIPSVAKTSPFTAEGKPRMLFLSAWMAHDGRNLNGDAFVKEELATRVKEGLFAPPYAGMIDHDHDFQPRGYWYKTSFAYDSLAKKWGILAHGAIWAWNFPDLADFLKSEMDKHGEIKVSMSTIGETAEVRFDYPEFVGQRTKIIHNPVFFTTSTLSVPPGDEFGRGKASETLDRKIVDPSGTNPEISISEANMANKTEPAGSAPETARALNKLIFPKAFWKTADAVIEFAVNENLGSWAISSEGDGFVLLMLDDSNFKAGTMVTTCIAGEASNCAIKAVYGELNVEGDIANDKVKALTAPVDQKLLTPIQEAYKKVVAKEMDKDEPDPDKTKADENDKGEPNNKDKFHNEKAADKSAEPKAEPVKDSDKTSNYSKSEGAPEPVGDEPKSMDGTCADDTKKDDKGVDYQGKKVEKVQEVEEEAKAKTEKPGDKKDDKEPDADDDDKSKAASAPVNTEKTGGEPKDGTPDTHPAMIDPVQSVQHQDQTLSDNTKTTEHKGDKAALPAPEGHNNDGREIVAKLEAANARIEALTAEITALKADNDMMKIKLTNYEAKKAEEESDAKLTARLAKLPEVVRANLSKHSEKDTIIEKWRKMSDIEWEVTKSMFNVAHLGRGYLELSEREGLLPVGGSTAAGTKTLKEYLRD